MWNKNIIKKTEGIQRRLQDVKIKGTTPNLSKKLRDVSYKHRVWAQDVYHVHLLKLNSGHVIPTTGLTKYSY